MIELFSKRGSRGVLLAVAVTLGLATPGVVHAQAIGAIKIPNMPKLPNMVGFGVGPTPDFVGADSRHIGLAPIFRYQFTGSERYVSLMGPLASFNLVNEKTWHAGPLLRYRSGRSDADDALVRKLHEIDDTVEIGAFVSYRWFGQGRVPWRIQVSANVLQGFNNADGTRLSVGGHVLLPLSRWALVGVGGSFSFIDGKTMQSYYGITPADSANTGLAAFEPGGGLSSNDLWVGLSFLVGKRWIIGGGVYWQRLRGHAADSPWVSKRGRVNQISYGVGLVYFWD